VDTENLVRSENTEVPIIREIMAATTMSSLFVAFFILLASTFRTRAALQTEILALRHQLAVTARLVFRSGYQPLLLTIRRRGVFFLLILRGKQAYGRQAE
jgi:hypothetical protein